MNKMSEDQVKMALGILRGVVDLKEHKCFVKSGHVRRLVTRASKILDQVDGAMGDENYIKIPTDIGD